MKKKEKKYLTIAIVILICVGIIFKSLLPKYIKLEYGYIDNNDAIIASSQALGDELFLNPLKVKSIRHEGDLNLVYFTREDGFSFEDEMNKTFDDDTLVQVYVINNESEEVNDILRVKELSGREYDVYIELKDGVMKIDKKL